MDELIEQVTQGEDGLGEHRNRHQQGCVHCQAALADYRRLWAPMAELAAEPVPLPKQRFDVVLRQLRERLERPDYALLAGPDGVVRIAARVVTATARRTAQQIPGVRVALTRRTGHPLEGGGHDPGPRAEAGVAGAHTALEVIIAADYGTDLHDLAGRVRSAITETVTAITGLTVAEVAVIIDDVLPPPPGPRGTIS
ncbi:Asp23/Gls24 family envelope stress response protein [Pseudonocardia ailaonensis]|uniref:Asp23/Gls24 family envelope stress response protein n=1 Tax=Pseudonocardia ailaonensis TaxID=367279 RepID=UPI0031D7D675